jgi:hypothetical protein
VLLFYYDQSVMDSAFSAAESLEYTGFVVTADRTLLINFPEIKAADEANMARLVQTMRKDRSGALRVKLDGQDKTVYYTGGEGAYADWVLGITLNTDRIQVSTVGTIVLIIQAAVVMALVFFLFAAFKRGEKKTPAVSIEKKEGDRVESTVSEVESEQWATHPDADTPAENMEEWEAGVVSLDVLEEVEEFQEVGEAEVAQEIEELEPIEELGEEQGFHDEESQLEIRTSETEEAVAPEEEESRTVPERSEQTEAKEDGTGASKREEEWAAENVEEFIENDRGDLDRYAENPYGELPKLDKLLDVPASEIEEDTVDFSLDLKEPEEEEPGSESQDDGFPPTIPDEAYEPDDTGPDDELAKLIHLIENTERPLSSGAAGGKPDVDHPIKTGGAQASEEFRTFMRRLGLSKGALLVEFGGTYWSAVTLGLSENTTRTLQFGADEKIVHDILIRDKILYVRDDAFMSRLMRAKFDLQDTSTVKRLFFAPIFDPHREVPLVAILMICLTTGEAIAEHSRSEKILKELKRIKKDLPNII